MRTRYQARIVNYADDFVILCRRRAEDALAAMRDMMQRLKLTVNEDENARLSPACRIVRLPWVYVRSDVLTANGRGLSRCATGAQEGARRLPSTQRVGGQTADVHPAGSVGLPGQSGVARVGQLLCWNLPAAFQVVHRTPLRVRRWLRQAEGLATQGRSLSTRTPIWSSSGSNLTQFPRGHSWAKS